MEKKTNDVPLKDIASEPCYVDVEEGIEQSGSCGRFQIFLQLLLTYFVICTGYTAFLPYFILDDPPWTCSNKNINATNATNHFCSQNFGKIISTESKDFGERCNMNSSDWSYTTIKKYSILTEFDLVCDKAPQAAMINSVFFIGAILSAIVSGKCSDTYGRKPVLLCLLIIILISGVALSFASTVWQLMAIRVLYGTGLPFFNIGVIYLMEFIPSKYRAMSGLLYQTPYSFSVLFFDLVGYVERRWRRVQLYVVLPILVAYVPLMFVPESPRWLHVVGKTDEAEKVIGGIAKRNKVALRAKLQPPASGEKCSSYTYIDLFRYKRVAMITLSQACLWLTAAMLYYAIGLESSKLGGDMYQVFALSTLCELPGSLASLYICNRLGRKKCILGVLFLCAVFLCGIAVIPRWYAEEHSALNIAFALLAKFFVNIAYCSLFVWSFEINPTAIRSQGLLLFNVLEHTGGIVAPFLVNVLQNVNYILPFIVMSAFTLMACCFGLILPETNNKPTREKFEDFFESETVPDVKEQAKENVS